MTPERPKTNIETAQEQRLDAYLPGVPVLPPLATLSDFADVIFASDNEWGVPLLDSQMQADALALPFDGWGTRSRQARGAGQRGTYHFYVDDYRFNALWKKPWKLLESGCVAAVEPNYSIDLQSPPAFMLWTIYKKRWLNRYWQSKGIYTIVDLAAPPEFHHLNMLGVPRDWKAFAVRGFTRRLAAIIAHYHAVQESQGGDRLMFIVQGGGKEVQAAARDYGWIYMPEQSDLARGRVGA